MSQASGPAAAVLLTGFSVVAVAGALAFGGALLWKSFRQQGLEETARRVAAEQAAQQLQDAKLRLTRELEESRAKEKAMARQLAEAQDAAERARLQAELDSAIRDSAAARRRAPGSVRAP